MWTFRAGFRWDTGTEGISAVVARLGQSATRPAAPPRRIAALPGPRSSTLVSWRGERVSTRIQKNAAAPGVPSSCTRPRSALDRPLVEGITPPRRTAGAAGHSSNRAALFRSAMGGKQLGVDCEAFGPTANCTASSCKESSHLSLHGGGSRDPKPEGDVAFLAHRDTVHQSAENGQNEGAEQRTDRRVRS